MSLWYTAHLVMYVKGKDGVTGKCRVWENLVLIKLLTPHATTPSGRKRAGKPPASRRHSVPT